MQNEIRQSAGLAPIPPALSRIGAIRDLETWTRSKLLHYWTTRPEPLGDVQDTPLMDVLDHGRLIIWVIAPLAKAAYGPEAEKLVLSWAETCRDIGRPWANEMHPAEFPKAPDKSGQILDCIENLALKLDRTISVLTQKKGRGYRSRVKAQLRRVA